MVSWTEERLVPLAIEVAPPMLLILHLDWPLWVIGTDLHRSPDVDMAAMAETARRCWVDPRHNVEESQSLLGEDDPQER